MSTRQKIIKHIGKFADGVLKLADRGARKIGDYAAKNAEENKSKNSKKIAEAMNRVSQNIEQSREQYVAKVEENAEELVMSAQKAFHEMKTRATAAKKKALKDTEEGVGTKSAEAPIVDKPKVAKKKKAAD